MNDFDRHVKIAREMGENNFCAVAAVASACYQDFDFVHGLFAKAGRRHGGRTPDRIIRAVLKQLGRTTVKVTHFYYAKTIKTLEKEVADAGNRDILLVRTRGHILCVREGEILDWTKDRRHRIKRIEKVVCKKSRRE